MLNDWLLSLYASACRNNIGSHACVSVCVYEFIQLYPVTFVVWSLVQQSVFSFADVNICSCSRWHCVCRRQVGAVVCRCRSLIFLCWRAVVAFVSLYTGSPRCLLWNVWFYVLISCCLSGFESYFLQTAIFLFLKIILLSIFEAMNTGNCCLLYSNFHMFITQHICSWTLKFC